jgi:uncharacterized phage protein (TIGR01671 family)
MMREIKFRVRDKKNKKMYCGFELDDKYEFDRPNLIDFNGELYASGNIGDGFGSQYINYCNQEDFVLMQYTGLKDKNGKEIYEGDIVRVITDKKGVIGEVVYIPEETAFCVKAKGFETFPLGLLSNFFEIEVLGNIYENPELLEEGGGILCKTNCHMIHQPKQV